jgi:hypothetical protein
MSASQHRGKYAAFAEWLAQQKTAPLRLTFGRVEDVLGFALPASARRHNAYWSGGQPGSTIGNAIRDAGWRAVDLNLTAERVTLERN